MKPLWRLLPCTLVLLAAGTAPPAAGQKPDEGTVVELDGLKSKTPADWQKQKPANRLRSHQFKVPRTKGDPADAELAISPEQRGTSEQKVQGWKDWFEPPAGKTLDEVSKVESFMVGAAKVTYLDVSGTYLNLPRPLAPKSQAKPLPHYRMLAVYLETKGDKFFIRLIGPEKTVAQQKAAFDAWLKALK